ncbi:hypothetical protein ACFQV4_29315 [Streptomyces thermocarboxydus]
MTVARQAAAVGRDPRRIHELAAHHLEQQGVLAPERLLKNADGTAWGRTLDGTDRPRGTFDPSVITLLGRGPDGSLVPVGSEPAPWATQPGRPTPSSTSPTATPTSSCCRVRPRPQCPPGSSANWSSTTRNCSTRPATPR